MNRRQFLAVIGVLLSLLIGMKPLYAMPQGGTVTGGNATISFAGNDVIINQESGQAVIDWNSFNIGRYERALFLQPSIRAAILNRIHDANPSEILGTLQANGMVFIVNASGVVFGPNAQVNVGGLVASTANITNKNFMAGNYQFEPVQPASPQSPSGAVINQGNIKSRYGLVALLGTAVANSGEIQADLGNVVLGAGEQYTLAFDGDQMINFSVGGQVTQPAVDAHGNKLSDAIKNTGTIVADGGKILVSAEVAKDVVDNVINMQGVLQARTVGMHHGEIILSGGNNGVVEVGGVLNVSGHADKHDQGGTVKITGKNILIDSSAVIDASGNGDGGEILIGGNFHGAHLTNGNQTLNNATATVVAPGAFLDADSVYQGDGGKVVVWSDNFTRFYGDISARGGEKSGNGGVVETSGKEILNVGDTAQVYTRAPHGINGTWLLDPFTITITAGPSTNGSFSGGNPNTFTPSGGGPIPPVPPGDATDATASVTTIQNSLNSGTDVVIQAGSTGDAIIVAVPITWNTGNTLTLDASGGVGSITINSGCNISGGNLSLKSGNAININANIYLSGNLTTSSSSNGTTTINGVAITTGGTQTYNTLVSAAAASTLTGNNIIFARGTSGSTINVIGSGNNPTLNNTAGNNTWRITGGNSGTLSNITFSNIANLVGGSSDIFMLFNGGSLTGSLSDSSNNATLDYSNYSGSAAVGLSSGNSGSATGIAGGFSGFNNLMGGSNVTLSVNAGVNATYSANGSSGQITINGVVFRYTGVNVLQAEVASVEASADAGNGINNATITGSGQTSAFNTTGATNDSSQLGGSTAAEQDLITTQTINNKVNSNTAEIKTQQDSQDIQQRDGQQFSNCS